MATLAEVHVCSPLLALDMLGSQRWRLVGGAADGMLTDVVPVT